MAMQEFQLMSRVAMLAAAGVCMLALSTSAQEAVTANVIFDTENAVGASSTGLRSVSAYRQRGDSSLVSDGLEDPVYEVDIPLGQQGYYRVYAWWPQVAGNSDGGLVRYEITADAAVESITLEQGGREGQWVRLGDFPVMRSDKLALKVSAGGPGSMAVDAFRLAYLGLTPPPLVITTGALELATRGQPYALTLEASGASAGLVWMAANALPRGLQLDPATGELSGSPEEAGVYTLEIHASQQDGDSASAELELVVVAPAPSAVLDSIGISAIRLADVPQAGAADGHSLLDEVAAMPEGSWQRVNMNRFSDSWTPAGLRTPKGIGATVPTPHKLISAWSSFAWDYHTGTMFLYGGGHANYAGNDVYLWRSATRMWERASLPSEVTQNDLGTWQAIDGPMAAPNSSHTYDNNVYLPVARRFMIYGGAAYDNGGAFTIQTGPDTERPTGPYVFDPSLANPWQVGGTTGSHVQRVASYPEVTGGEMWSNRDIYATIPGSPELPSNYVMGATAVVIENGNDVIYVNAKTGGSARQLFKHTIRDIDDPTQDTFVKVGRFSSAFGKQAAGAYSASDNVFVRAGETLTYWDLDTAGTGNRNQLFVPADPSGEFEFSFNYGLDYSPVREVFYLWGGGSTVWRLVPPELMSSDGWVLQKESFAGGDAPYDDPGTGILGKWKFARDLNAFVALQDPDQGNVWIYKPAGWRAPGAPNQAPSAALSAPLEGAVFNLGEAITLAAEAGDADGSVTAVQFYNGSVLLGVATVAPYTYNWSNAPLGSYQLQARAVDNNGAVGWSDTIAIAVVEDNLPPNVSLPQDLLDDCLSKAIWDIWVAGGDMFPLLHPKYAPQGEKDLLAQHIRKIGPMAVEVQGVEYVCPALEQGDQKSNRQKLMKRTMRDLLQ